MSGFERVPAVVFACLIPEEIRIILHPGAGLADGRAPRDVPVEQIPFELRMPNTPLWVHFDEEWNILRVWKREEEIRAPERAKGLPSRLF